MVITISAVVFLLFIILIAIVGYKAITRKERRLTESNSEKCSLCKEEFDKSQLVERQIGDYKLMYFCRKCILQLYSDLGLKN